MGDDAPPIRRGPATGRACLLAAVLLCAFGHDVREVRAQTAPTLPKETSSASSAPERIAAALSTTGAMVADRGTLYLTDWGHASTLPAGPGAHHPRNLEETPKWGEIVTTDWRLATDEAFVYATTDVGMLFRVAKTGGHARPVATYGQGYPGRVAHLALDATYVYLTHFITHRVLRVPKTGGKPDTLFTDPERRYPGEIAVDARFVYWVNQSDGSLLAMPKSGGAPVVLGKGSGRSFGLAVDAKTAFMTDFDGGRVLAVPLSGGPTVVLAKDQGNPSGLVLDGDRLYFTDADRGTVSVVPKDGSAPPVVIASGQPMPAAIAVSGDAIYWVDVATGDSDGTVMRLRRP